jgi:hypothetical protein
LAIALALVALVAALALALHALVDPERVKSVAREKARAAWGRELTLGDASVGLFPVPSISAADVSLSAADGRTPFLRAKRIDARLALLPLITGKTVVKSIALEDAQVVVAGGPPWHIDEATLGSDPGWRNVAIDAKASRNGEPLHVTAEIADLSRIGADGAASHGHVELAWKQTHVAIKGRLPLDHAATGADAHVDVQSPSLGDVFAFSALERRHSAPLEAHFDLKGAGDRLDVTGLRLTLGAAHGKGSFSLGQVGNARRFRGRIAIDRLDWGQAMLDAGTPPPPKHTANLAFQPDRLAWGLLEKLAGWQGTLESDVGTLKLRSGMELKGARFHFAFDGNRLDVQPVEADLLGGHGKAELRFEGATRTVKIAFDGTSVLLERWFHDRGRNFPFTGGPMNVHADLTSRGETTRDLAASATGTFTVRMGPGSWNSKHAGDREALMTNAFASQGAQSIQFECVTANLPFKDGVARGRSMVGFKTEASELITSGVVDLRDESVDLHGHVHAHKGVTLGLATIAGDVRIGGHLTKLEMSLDPKATAGVIARAGAAIATLGVSVVGTALIEKLAPDRADPCERPVRKKGGESAGR